MWDRTLTIGSAGKTFSVTGWKLGWAYGPESIIRPMQLVHQNSVYTCSTPTQEAVAVAFEKEIARLGQPDSYWKELSEMLEAKRNQMATFLSSAKMNPVLPDGGYFMIADFSKLAEKFDYSGEDGDTNDYKFVKWLTKNKVRNVEIFVELFNQRSNCCYRNCKEFLHQLFMVMQTNIWLQT